MVFKTTEPFFSKAQLEVWECKPTLAEETQHLTTAEALNLVKKSQKTVAYLKNQKRLLETTLTDPLR